ncbi:MAG TPA: hypothetical protein VI451_03665 [Anaerolineales bacterium]|nr:hypothetical protein [Anaerolineales bacterium]
MEKTFFHGNSVVITDPDKILFEAKQAGVDLDALRYNLSLTPAQRLEKFLKAFAWYELAKASRRKDDRKENV